MNPPAATKAPYRRHIHSLLCLFCKTLSTTPNLCWFVFLDSFPVPTATGFEVSSTSCAAVQLSVLDGYFWPAALLCSFLCWMVIFDQAALLCSFLCWMVILMAVRTMGWLTDCWGAPPGWETGLLADLHQSPATLLRDKGSYFPSYPGDLGAHSSPWRGWMHLENVTLLNLTPKGCSTG